VGTLSPCAACFHRMIREAVVGWRQVRANWRQLQRHAKLRWDRLTDDDIAQIKGHREALIACLEQRYGYDHNRAQQEVRGWEHQFD
jgi:uncharacterized protein YjbJ (UPF0337 family)